MASETKRHWAMFLDFDSFFAHVEKQDDPALRGRPVGVCPTPSPYSGLIACCYQAKAFGVKRGMSRKDALALCPDLVFRPARHDVYIQKHHQIVAVIERHVPIEKAHSVDEMSIDLKRMRLSDAVALVKAIKRDLAEALGPQVTASFGIAQTSLLAKIAAEADKPDGLVVFHPDDMPDRLYDIPLGDIPGVARGILVRLRRAGVTTTEDLLALQPKHVRRIWGSVEGERVWRALHGQHTERPPTKRSMFGHSRVLARSWRTPKKAGECLRILCTHAARRLRADDYFATRMTVSAKLAASGAQDVKRLSLEREFPAVRDDFSLGRILSETFDAMVAQAQAKEQAPQFIQVSIMLHGILKETEIVGDLFTGPRDLPRTDKAVHVMDALNLKYEKSVLRIGAPDALPGGYDGIKIAFGRIPTAADIIAAKPVGRGAAGPRKRQGGRKR